LLLTHLRTTDERYEQVDREMSYPNGIAKCNLVLPTGMSVAAKLIRYW
jgi:hypothetical protein